MHPASDSTPSADRQAPESIVVTEVEKYFPGTAEPALAKLSAVIHGGAVVGLVGPDGAGKTTLMRMLAGFLIPSGGNIRVAGLDPVAQSRTLRGILGYMPQRFGLYEDLTVQENLDLYASLRDVSDNDREKSFARLLDFTSLRPFTARLAGDLSGGMKQKLGLACTLLGSPKVLLLDEPGVGVDPISSRDLWRMVHELAGEGMIILWSTAYLDEAEECREVFLLNQGKLLYNGPPADLTRTMRGRSFLATTAPGQKRHLLRKALALAEVSDGIIQGDYVRLVLRKEASPDAVRSALPGLLETILPTDPSFEDAFVDLLGGGPSPGAALKGFSGRTEGGENHGVTIQAIDLTKKFGAFTAADHVNFTVKTGEVFGLLGPNGAGKSTTFKMMCGLLRPTSGQPLVLGLDLRKHASRVKERLGYMAQKFSLYGTLSVLQNLRFFSGIYGLSGSLREERVQEMVSLFDFAPMLDQTADSLPLGFKQRLALACSLMQRPQILFLDEPTSGVDPLTRREFWLQINSMVEQGVTVMVTTHFMDEAEYCDRLALVYHGRIIAEGTPDTLKSSVRDTELREPTMEDAFVALIRRYDAENADGSSTSSGQPSASRSG